MYQDKAIELAEALESGQYKQCRGALKIGEAYCCLGVASELIGDLNDEGMNSDGIDLSLSQKVKLYFSFRTPYGSFNGEGVAVENLRTPVVNCLADMNDNGKTFTEIAAFIRERWADL